MLKVAINIIPLISAHKNRGIGYYTYNLIESLKKDNTISLSTFSKINDVRGVDIIHYPWFDLYFHTLPFQKIAPLVVTIHDVIPLVFNKHYPVGIKGKINFALQRLALRKSKAIITDSETSKNDIIKHLKINQSRITVTPLAAENSFRILSEDKKLLIKRKYRLPDRFILYTGDVNWVKNIPLLIEGFGMLKKEENFSDVKLVLVGNAFLKKVDNIDHPELKSLKLISELITKLNLEKEIIKVGQVDINSLVGIYNLATVYIQPSFYEGFGLPIVEAMSCGTPVICSKAGSLPEVGGGAAVYFNPENIHQFIKIVKEVLEDRSLRTKLSQLGLKEAANYSWEKTAQDTIKVYRSIKT